MVGQNAVLVLAAVAIKGAFCDMLQTDSTTRVLSLLVAGLLLYLCGWFYRQMQAWS
jgi:uncharacterized membrane protein